MHAPVNNGHMVGIYSAVEYGSAVTKGEKEDENDTQSKLETKASSISALQAEVARLIEEKHVASEIFAETLAKYEEEIRFLKATLESSGTMGRTVVNGMGSGRFLANVSDENLCNEKDQSVGDPVCGESISNADERQATSKYCGGGNTTASNFSGDGTRTSIKKYASGDGWSFSALKIKGWNKEGYVGMGIRPAAQCHKVNHSGINESGNDRYIEGSQSQRSFCDEKYVNRNPTDGSPIAQSLSAVKIEPENTDERSWVEDDSITNYNDSYLTSNSLPIIPNFTDESSKLHMATTSPEQIQQTPAYQSSGPMSTRSAHGRSWKTLFFNRDRPFAASLWTTGVRGTPAVSGSSAKQSSFSLDNSGNVLNSADWIDRILPDWKNQVGTLQFNILLRNGVPHDVRGEVWKKAVGDALYLTPAFYELLVQRVGNARQRLLVTSQKYRDRIAKTMGSASDTDEYCSSDDVALDDVSVELCGTQVKGSLKCELTKACSSLSTQSGMGIKDDANKSTSHATREEAVEADENNLVAIDGSECPVERMTREFRADSGCDVETAPSADENAPVDEGQQGNVLHNEFESSGKRHLFVPTNACENAPVADAIECSGPRSFKVKDGVGTDGEGRPSSVESKTPVMQQMLSLCYAASAQCDCGAFAWEREVYASFQAICNDLHRTLPRLGVFRRNKQVSNPHSAESSGCFGGSELQRRPPDITLDTKEKIAHSYYEETGRNECFSGTNSSSSSTNAAGSAQCSNNNREYNRSGSGMHSGISREGSVAPVPFRISSGFLLEESLRSVLETHVMFRPDLGYVQGMAFVAATLLLYMEEFSAFVCFANLLLRRSLKAFYTFDMAEVELYFRSFDYLLAEKLPAVAFRFEELEIDSDMFLVDWMYTVFTSIPVRFVCRCLPFELLSRVWDLFLIEGDVVLFQTALAIIEYFEDELQNGTLEDCLSLLSQSTTARFQAMNPGRFLELLSNTGVTVDKLDETMRIVQTSQDENKRRSQKRGTLRLEFNVNALFNERTFKGIMKTITPMKTESAKM